MSTYFNLIEYLKKQHVLSLCATNGKDLWCANCFYVFNETDTSFLLMTEVKTRHSQLMLQNSQVAGTVNCQQKTILLIKGIQYSGQIVLLNDKRKWQAQRAYQKRFPIAKKVSTALWEIIIDEMKMTNNMLGFGKKIIWHRSKS
ncbi:YhbP family protein [Candidatus Pantoea carbekii]|uniref:UPF0306 protein HHS_03810 n=1 Tax=Candidatus Pantoea carbekii TaxID=1235990 RepID=U3U2J7_9GAMM|nr:YhbP family protein [Candidatus Pantoea carbekii]AKC31841.1 hypothetical protein BMSBPS_0009 [Candidatus Pantoea carbekii]BAO00351.1 hypothetical protein HHS_03810 [Candidatus Pantoea carbekii]